MIRSDCHASPRPQRQREQGRDAAQLARRARCRRVIDAVRVCVDAGAPGITVHPRADARHITHADVQRDRGVSRAEAPRRSSSTSKAIRGRTCSSWCARCARTSARSCPCARRDHEPGRLAGRHAGRGPAARSCATCRSAASASACSSIPTRRPCVGGVARRGRDRALHRAVRARVQGGRGRGGPELPRYVEAANLAHALGLGINAGHDLDLDNLRCSGRCRTSTKCPSATRSSATRFMWGWTGRSGTIWG